MGMVCGCDDKGGKDMVGGLQHFFGFDTELLSEGELKYFAKSGQSKRNYIELFKYITSKERKRTILIQQDNIKVSFINPIDTPIDTETPIYMGEFIFDKVSCQNLCRFLHDSTERKEWDRLLAKKGLDFSKDFGYDNNPCIVLERHVYKLPIKGSEMREVFFKKAEFSEKAEYVYFSSLPDDLINTRNEDVKHAAEESGRKSATTAIGTIPRSHILFGMHKLERLPNYQCKLTAIMQVKDETQGDYQDKLNPILLGNVPNWYQNLKTYIANQFEEAPAIKENIRNEKDAMDALKAGVKAKLQNQELPEKK